MPPIHPNPFGIDYHNFMPAAPLCRRTTDLDNANISNIAVGCGMVYGVPQRFDAGDPLISKDPGSKWSIPLSSCATGVRAIIKTVSFRFNGTDNLAGLTVTEITPKVYSDTSSKPLWGVENTDMVLGNVKPLWGLVTPEKANQLGEVAALRNNHLWLPGVVGQSTYSPEPHHQNLPGVEFYISALDLTYSVTGGGGGGLFDYSGSTSVALFRKWQQLSQVAPGTARVLDLVWTDVAANYVLGTRGLATTSTASADTDANPANNIPVVAYAPRVRFHIVYGIPAFLTLALVVLILVVAAVVIFLQGSGIRRMTAFLSWTSVGRIYTSQTPRDASALFVSLKPSEQWVKEEGTSISFRGMIKSTKEALSGGTHYDTIYPAAPDLTQLTTLISTRDIVHYINDGLQNCPDQKYALLEYSQSVTVNLEAIQNLTVMPAEAAIRAVVFIGNLYQVKGQISTVDENGGDLTRD
ncbi:hypothetical protein BDV12DRAFT_202981 [Aspergillus spectabilis]